MFSRLLHYSATFLFPYTNSEELTSTFRAGKQISSELERAAEQGMVSTRSQDNTPAGGASHPMKELYPQVVVLEKKRKAAYGAEESPAQDVRKRRRRSASVKSNGDATPSPNARRPGRPRKRTSADTLNGGATYAVDHDKPDPESSTQGSGPQGPQAPRVTTEQTIDDDKEDTAIEVAINEPDLRTSLDDEVSEAHDQVVSYPDSARRSRMGKIPKKRTKHSDGNAGTDENGTDISALGKKIESSSTTVAKATHKRFGSEDIEVLGPVPSTVIEDREEGQEDLAEDNGESEDEAPETVTASVGFDKARASALDAAKVAARYILSRLRLCRRKGEKADWD